MIFKDMLLEGIGMYIPKTNNGFYNKLCLVHPFNYDFKQMINKKQIMDEISGNEEPHGTASVQKHEI